jgi:hypothetical protein
VSIYDNVADSPIKALKGYVAMRVKRKHTRWGLHDGSRQLTVYTARWDKQKGIVHIFIFLFLNVELISH